MDRLVPVMVLSLLAGCATSPTSTPPAAQKSVTTQTNVLLTGSMLPVPATPTAAALLGTRIYSQEEMQRWGSVSLDDFLRRVPGLRVDRR